MNNFSESDTTDCEVWIQENNITGANLTETFWLEYLKLCIGPQR